jgi:hypothetical protein
MCQEISKLSKTIKKKLDVTFSGSCIENRLVLTGYTWKIL